MKVIGLLGGMSWESTLYYYQHINREVSKRLGGFHSAKIVMVSVDFAELEDNMRDGNWGACAEILVPAAQNVEAAGAECLIICTNTMHKVAPEVEKAVSIPLLHIADAAGDALVQRGITAIGLLGTRFTMEEDFYKLRLAEKYGLQVYTPSALERVLVDRIIFTELCRGKVTDDSRNEYLKIMKGLEQQGAEAILLGCTEIAMLVHHQHTDIPLFDTTAIHAAMAVRFSLAGMIQ